jgi:F-type H+-transporting ATPase subunit a
VAAGAKIDPMHQFVIEPIYGSFQHNNPFVFTNSALWLLIVLGTIYGFMLGGMKRQLVPGRWQVAVEGLIGFVDDMVHASIGPEGKKYLPWVFTAFTFLLFANLMGNMPFGIVSKAHPFTVTSQFTITGVMSLISFAIVLGVGFWKHGLHFFSLFVPPGIHWIGKVLLFPIEFISFMVRPFSLGLRPFIAMFAGHILVDIFGNFRVSMPRAPEF